MHKNILMYAMHCFFLQYLLIMPCTCEDICWLLEHLLDGKTLTSVKIGLKLKKTQIKENVQ